MPSSTSIVLARPLRPVSHAFFSYVAIYGGEVQEDLSA